MRSQIRITNLSRTLYKLLHLTGPATNRLLVSLFLFTLKLFCFAVVQFDVLVDSIKTMKIIIIDYNYNYLTRLN